MVVVPRPEEDESLYVKLNVGVGERRESIMAELFGLNHI